jgi:D-tyrosyl-tRNA(Tyr) deacylase
VGGETVGRIGAGLLVYLGVSEDDEPGDARWIAEKVGGLRIFDDAEGRMNLSVAEAAAELGRPASVLAVSQFTLMGDARKGRRPSWAKAAGHEKALALYELFMDEVRRQGLVCESGRFGADMKVASVNSGPVTILLDTREAGSPGEA